MNPQDFRNLIRMGTTTNFTISINDQELTNQKLRILIDKKNTFFIHSDDFNHSMNRDYWRMSGDANNIELTNLINSDKIKFQREQ